VDRDNPARYLARANQEQTLHRFKEARADVEQARKLGAPADDIAPLEQELDWNEGKYDAAVASIHAAARAKANDLYTIAREAQLHHDLGENDAADAEFERAEDAYRDTSPLPLAWLDVQRGVHLMKIGKTVLALPFFREAVARIPTYLMAQEHLAEALHIA